MTPPEPLSEAELDEIERLFGDVKHPGSVNQRCLLAMARASLAAEKLAEAVTIFCANYKEKPRPIGHALLVEALAAFRRATNAP